MVMLLELEPLPGKACCKGIFSKSVTDNIYSEAWREASKSRRLLTMATGTQTDTVIQTCVLTAFSDVPKKRLIQSCCLIHLKNSSTCQRFL